jgi:hypothetical protein
MAAGLQALSATIAFARNPAPCLPTDQSSRAGRFLVDRFDGLHWRGASMAAGTAVPQQKHAEIRFEGTAASCYPCGSMGAEGVVAITSRRPN